MPLQDQTDYEKYRGKCKQMSEALIVDDPSLTLVRGYYHCLIWGRQEHWWCKAKDGTIVDPTKDQFPSKGVGEYEEFNGYYECEQCGKEIKEEDVHGDGHHVFCSGECYGRCVGVI